MSQRTIRAIGTSIGVALFLTGCGGAGTEPEAAADAPATAVTREPTVTRETTPPQDAECKVGQRQYRGEERREYRCEDGNWIEEDGNGIESPGTAAGSDEAFDAYVEQNPLLGWFSANLVMWQNAYDAIKVAQNVTSSTAISKASLDVAMTFSDMMISIQAVPDSDAVSVILLTCSTGWMNASLAVGGNAALADDAEDQLAECNASLSGPIAAILDGLDGPRL